MKLTAILLIFVVVLLHGFKDKPKPAIRFKTLTSTIKSDTSAEIIVVIDNGEREREFSIRCTAWPDSIVLQGDFQAWYYNYSKRYTATIPLK